MARAFDRIVARRLERVVRDRMATEPVVVLQGARAVGKSTLLRRIAGPGTSLLDLDDIETRDAVRTDPGLFLSTSTPVLIDEFQHVPEVLDVIKSQLNIEATPGRFVITGSTRYATLPAAAQALTGRAHRIDVRPLSQGEIAEQPEENFVTTLLADPGDLTTTAAASVPRQEYVRRIVTGGFPLALRRDRQADRTRWFDDYIGLVLERDVIALSKVRQRRQLPLLLQQLASQTGQAPNIAKAARDIGLDRSTAEDYLKLLDAVFLVHRLPAWGTALGSRVAAAPKVHLGDSGLAAHLLRLTPDKLNAASPAALTEFGHLLETFVVGEMQKQLDWFEEPVTRGHWRTHDGDEVDLVVERSDGNVAAVEVKAGARITPQAVRALRKLRDRLGALFLGGLIVYTGSRSYTIDDRIHAVPVARLWHK